MFPGSGRMGKRGRVPTSAGIVYRYTGWRKALAAAGLPPPKGLRFDEADLARAFADVRALAAQLGRAPTTGDWAKTGRSPNRRWFLKRVGSWDEVLRQAGL